MSATITSSTHDRKSRCSIFFRNDRIYLKSSSLGDEVPIVIILKAMGLESDQEVVQMVGCEPEICELFSASLEEPYNMGILCKQQVYPLFSPSFTLIYLPSIGIELLGFTC